MNWQQVGGSSDAWRILKPAFNGDDELIINEIEKGRCKLFKCEAGYMVIRIEGDELVLVAGAGKNVNEALDDWLLHAKKLKFKSVRLHTNRAGMMKIAQQKNMTELERIYRVEF